jgi:cytochrome c-type biogenesis protein CcmE
MRKGRFLIGAVIIGMAVSYLVYAGIRETSVYYLKIDEFAGRKEALTGQAIRVAGRVAHGTMDWNAKTLDLRFGLGGFPADGEPGAAPSAAARSEIVPLDIEFNGILPDMFAEGRDVIVEGTYEGGNRFVAETILTSCPSKYEPEDPGS